MTPDDRIIAGDPPLNFPNAFGLPPASELAIRMEMDQMMRPLETGEEYLTTPVVLPVVQRLSVYLQLEYERFTETFEDIIRARRAELAEEHTLHELRLHTIRNIGNFLNRSKVWQAERQVEVIEPLVKDAGAAYGHLRSRYPEFGETKKALIEAVHTAKKVIADHLPYLNRDYFREIALQLQKLEDLLAQLTWL